MFPNVRPKFDLWSSGPRKGSQTSKNTLKKGVWGTAANHELVFLGRDIVVDKGQIKRVIWRGLGERKSIGRPCIRGRVVRLVAIYAGGIAGFTQGTAYNKIAIWTSGGI